MTDTFSRLQTILVSCLGVGEDDISEGSLFADDLGADSLDCVEIMMDIEDEFGIEIGDHESERIMSVQDAIITIERLVR